MAHSVSLLLWDDRPSLGFYGGHGAVDGAIHVISTAVSSFLHLFEAAFQQSFHFDVDVAKDLPDAVVKVLVDLTDERKGGLADTFIARVY